MLAALVAQDESDAAELASWEAEKASRGPPGDDAAAALEVLPHGPTLSRADDYEEETVTGVDANTSAEQGWEEVTRSKMPKPSVLASEPELEGSQTGESLQEDTTSGSSTIPDTTKSDEDNESTENAHEDQSLHTRAKSTNVTDEDHSITVNRPSSLAVTDGESKPGSEKSEDKPESSRYDHVPEWDDHIASMPIVWALPQPVPEPLIHTNPSAILTQSAGLTTGGSICEPDPSSNSPAADTTNSYVGSHKAISDSRSKKPIPVQEEKVNPPNSLPPVALALSRTPKSPTKLTPPTSFSSSKREKKRNKKNARNINNEHAAEGRSFELATQPEVDLSPATDLSTVELPAGVLLNMKEIPSKYNLPESVTCESGDNTAEEHKPKVSISTKIEKKMQEIMQPLAGASLRAEKMPSKGAICDQTTVVAEGEVANELVFETPNSNSTQVKKKKRGNKGGKKARKVDKSIVVKNSTDIKIGGVLVPWYALLAAIVAQLLLLVVGVRMAT
jgi:hypothetical protein